jgi:cation diffusion facilitator CzcD-associated flavoprotein CzcO
MLTRANSLPVIVENWLAQFEKAVATDPDSLRELFQDDCFWRDVLALTWRIGTVHGRDAVVSGLNAHARKARPRNFRIAPGRTPPRNVMRAGTDAIEAIFSFETADGIGSGVVRLTPDVDDHNSFKAWTLLTTLDEITARRQPAPPAKAYSRDFRGPNWLDVRNATSAYGDRDPTVLVVGGGHAGLSTAARLTALGIDTLIVDRGERIGDNWRKRYHALVLHNQVHVNHLPLMPFPPTWPTYIPKDKLAGWFEAYVEALELNYWTSTEFLGGNYDEPAKRWSVRLKRSDGSIREMHPRHIVMATGVSGIPSIPAIATLENFRGTVLHSHQYTDSEAWKGKTALIIGTGNSAHDIAQDLYSAGAARVTMAQRSSTMVVNVEPSAQLPYALYAEGPSLEDCDLITVATPTSLARKTHIALTQQAKAIDQPLLDGLARRGFKLDFGDDGSGWQFKYLTRGGGYYFNVGCSDLIVEGKVDLIQFADIAAFTAEGAKLRNGDLLPADLIVLATGYKGLEAMVEKLFGAKIARRVGPIWGFGDEQELRNMFARTPQPGLYFIAGSLAQCRIYSKYLGLLIKAGELGLIDARS